VNGYNNSRGRAFICGPWSREERLWRSQDGAIIASFGKRVMRTLQMAFAGGVPRFQKLIRLQPLSLLLGRSQITWIGVVNFKYVEGLADSG